MKTIKILTLFILFTSCKGKITNIKITPTKESEKYKSYIYWHRKPNSDLIKRYCSWIEDPINTIYIFKPVSFQITNHTGRKLIIHLINENLENNNYSSVIINGVFHDYFDSKKVIVASGEKVNITKFVHLPVPLSTLDKTISDKILFFKKNQIRDSILISNFNTELQEAMNIEFSKKIINLIYTESKNKKDMIAYYCPKNEHTAVFDIDSLATVKPYFQYKCN